MSRAPGIFYSAEDGSVSALTRDRLAEIRPLKSRALKYGVIRMRDGLMLAEGRLRSQCEPVAAYFASISVPCIVRHRNIGKHWLKAGQDYFQLKRDAARQRNNVGQKRSG